MIALYLLVCFLAHAKLGTTYHYQATKADTAEAVGQ